MCGVVDKKKTGIHPIEDECFNDQLVLQPVQHHNTGNDIRIYEVYFTVYPVKPFKTRLVTCVLIIRTLKQTTSNMCLKALKQK